MTVDLKAFLKRERIKRARRERYQRDKLTKQLRASLEAIK
jgi:hypothetical protein